MPRRWRQNKRVAPALLAGLAAATVAQNFLPAAAVAEHQQPQMALDLLAASGDETNLPGSIDLSNTQVGWADEQQEQSGMR